MRSVVIMIAPLWYLLQEQVLSFVLLSAPSRAGVNAPQESSLRNLRHPCSRLRLSGVAQDGDIDLNKAMTNARVNLAEGRSPGAGLESAFDQADAAFADLIVTSVDDQGLNLDDEVRRHHQWRGALDC